MTPRPANGRRTRRHGDRRPPVDDTPPDTVKIVRTLSEDLAQFGILIETSCANLDGAPKAILTAWRQIQPALQLAVAGAAQHFTETSR